MKKLLIRYFILVPSLLLGCATNSNPDNVPDNEIIPEESEFLSDVS